MNYCSIKEGLKMMGNFVDGLESMTSNEMIDSYEIDKILWDIKNKSRPEITYHYKPKYPVQLIEIKGEIL